MTIGERLWKTFNKALGQYQLIDEDDHILVGLSGGKDSLLLLEFLARRAKIHVPHFTVEALHVRMDFSEQHKNQSFVDTHYETNTSYLQHFCDQARCSPPHRHHQTLTEPPSHTPSRSPLASSAPGSVANSFSTSPRNCIAPRLPLVIIRMTSSILL